MVNGAFGCGRFLNAATACGSEDKGSSTKADTISLDFERSSRPRTIPRTSEYAAFLRKYSAHLLCEVYAVVHQIRCLPLFVVLNPKV